MAYLSDWFGAKGKRLAGGQATTQDGSGVEEPYYPAPDPKPGTPVSPIPPIPSGPPSGVAGPGPTAPPGYGVNQGPAGGGRAGPGTGFVPLAAYFAPNREGAQGLAQGLMDKYPHQAPIQYGGPGPDSGWIAGPTGPELVPAGYRTPTAETSAEAGSELSTMNPLDSFLAQQAGGQQLFSRLADWAKPYTPPTVNNRSGQVSTGPQVIPPVVGTGERTGGAMGGPPASQADADELRRRQEKYDEDRRRRGY